MRSALIKRNVKALTDGVYEMREKFGPGWRMYYVLRGKTIIVMLGGGDKSSQSNDIKVVKKLAKLLED
nr:type II toxin-antitoxin system RelE/ParE family toxin [Polynucleobacter sp. IMCC 29146]